MERATAPQMRRCLEAVEILKRVGIRFVPMPVLSEEDNDALAAEMKRRLEEIEKSCTQPAVGG